MVDDTDWARNDMTEAEWNALAPTDREWRKAHPKHPSPVTGGPTGARGATAPQRTTMVDTSRGGPSILPEPVRDDRGAQVILTGDARAAARGVHGSIEANTMARDAAISDGQVAHSFAADVDRQPPQYAIDAAIGAEPLPDMTVEQAQRALDAAKDREKEAKERNQRAQVKA